MPLEPRSLKAIALLAVLLFALLMSRMVGNGHSPSEPVPVPLVVEVLGDVRAPGTYLIDPAKPFVKEALHAAGLSEPSSSITDGAGRDASLLPLQNGRSLRVTRTPEGTCSVDIGLMPAAARLVLGEKLDLGSVAEEDLLLIPGMRPDLAAAIVSRRNRAPWAALDDLREIPGIGPRLVERWKDYLEVR